MEFWIKNDGSKKKFSIMKNRFRSLIDVSQLYKFQDDLEKDRNYKENVEKIEKFTINKFALSKINRLNVHDVDLKRWSLEKAR